MRRTLFLAIALSAFAVSAQEAGHEAAAAGAEHGPATHAEDPLAKWKWINFAVLAAGIIYLINKSAVPAFRQTREDIASALNVGVRRSEEAMAQARAVEAKMAQLGSAVAELKTSSKHEMQLEAQRIQAETTAQLAKVQRNAEQEIASAAKESLQQLKVYSSELALELAKQKIQARMNPEAQGELVRQFVHNLGATGRN